MRPPAVQIETPAVLEPTYRLAFPEAGEVLGVAAAPDGAHAYANTLVEVVDLWALAAAHWPELLGGLTALLALLALAADLRRSPSSRPTRDQTLRAPLTASPPWLLAPAATPRRRHPPRPARRCRRP